MYSYIAVCFDNHALLSITDCKTIELLKIAETFEDIDTVG